MWSVTSVRSDSLPTRVSLLGRNLEMVRCPTVISSSVQVLQKKDAKGRFIFACTVMSSGALRDSEKGTQGMVVCSL